MSARNRVAAVVIPVTMAFGGAITDAADKPNILFIFADDQCWETIAALGNDEIETPNLDRLVRRGVTFTHACNQGSFSPAVCHASRAMLNTGRYLWHSADLWNQNEQIGRISNKQRRRAGFLWSDYMRQAGYETYMTGKWHIEGLGVRARRVFDHVSHVRPGMPNQTKEGTNRPLPGKPDPWSPWDTKFDGYWKGGRHWSEVVGDDTIRFLNAAASNEKPFFIYSAFNAPHDPRQSPREYVEKYPVEKIRVPVNFLPVYPFRDQIACGHTLRDEALAPFPRTEHAVKVHRQEYYAIITHMDAQIGRMTDALKASGKASDTYIFFTADHGLAVGQHGLMGKQNLFDHSIRVPLIVVGPDLPGNRRIKNRVYLQDIMPTTLELAGVPKPHHVQFNSLLPQLRGETTEGRDAIYGGYLEVQRSVTQDNYKLILYPKAQQVLLFNLRNDPYETRNLAASVDHEPRIRRMFARLLELQKETGDSIDLTETFWQLQG